MRYGKSTRRAKAGLHDPQTMILTTESGVRIDVESFVCNGQCYDICCKVVCEDAILNLTKTATIEVLANTVRGNAEDALSRRTTWSFRSGSMLARPVG